MTQFYKRRQKHWKTCLDQTNTRAHKYYSKQTPSLFQARICCPNDFDNIRFWDGKTHKIEFALRYMKTPSAKSRKMFGIESKLLLLLLRRRPKTKNGRNIDAKRAKAVVEIKYLLILFSKQRNKIYADQESGQCG